MTESTHEAYDKSKEELSQKEEEKATTKLVVAYVFWGPHKIRVVQNSEWQDTN